MCVHTQEEANAARETLKNWILPQIEQENADAAKLFELHDFCLCMAEKFDILSGLSEQYEINGRPLDLGDFSNYSDKLEETGQTFEDTAKYLEEVIKSMLDKALADANATIAKEDEDCYACYLAALQAYIDSHS